MPPYIKPWEGCNITSQVFLKKINNIDQTLNKDYQTHIERHSVK